jgi:hypothetical protein
MTMLPRYLAAVLLSAHLAVVAHGETGSAAISVEEYVRRLNDCSACIEAATRGEGGRESLVTALGECESQLCRLTVERSDGPLQVRNEWVAELLEEVEYEIDSPEYVRRAALARLGALREEVSRPVMLSPSPDAEEILAGVLSREEFGFRRPTPEQSRWIQWVRRRIEEIGQAIGRFLEAIFNRLEDWLGFLIPEDGGRETGTQLGRAILYVLAAIVLGLGVYALARLVANIKPRLARKEYNEEDEEIIELPRPEELLTRAASLREQGECRQGIRFVYLALLAFLEDQGLVRYDRSKTNWEYAQELGRSFPQRDRFLFLTRSFDRVWYGMESVTAEDYASFHRGFEETVRPGGEI